jgi:hypothetical protein
MRKQFTGLLSLLWGAGMLMACQPTETQSAADRPSWQQEGNIYRLDAFGFRLEAAPQQGGRIISLSRGNRNMLTGPEVDSLNFGSTLWLSPQDLWRWPPPDALDRLAYDSQLKGDTLQMLSPVDERFACRFVKKIWLHEPDSSFVLDYTIINEADSIQTYAIWEVSRMHKGGCILFPLEEDSSLYSLKPLNWQRSGEYIHHQVGTQDKQTNKLYANGKGRLLYRLDSLLLIKKFTNLRRDEMPPRHQEVEFYIDDTAYVEVEQHSRYVSLQPGGSYRWQVRWYPRIERNNAACEDLKHLLESFSGITKTSF